MGQGCQGGGERAHMQASMAMMARYVCFHFIKMHKTVHSDLADCAAGIFSLMLLWSVDFVSKLMLWRRNYQGSGQPSRIRPATGDHAGIPCPATS